MKSDCERLYAEISEIATQYQREVPSGRRAWPESIRSRVFALRRSGVRSSEISRRTGLPYYTVLQWKDAGPKFVELPVRLDPAKSATVTVPTRDEVPPDRVVCRRRSRVGFYLRRFFPGCGA